MDGCPARFPWNAGAKLKSGGSGAFALDDFVELAWSLASFQTKDGERVSCASKALVASREKPESSFVEAWRPLSQRFRIVALQ